VEAYCGALEQMPPRADLEQAKRWAEIFNQEYARQGLPPLAAPRSLHELCEAARQANCGECWTGPGDECVFTTLPESLPVTPDTPVHPAKGYHVARFSRAMRRGLITGPELVAVPETAHGFTPATVYDRVLGGAR
jgi:hypothetical protein